MVERRRGLVDHAQLYLPFEVERGDDGGGEDLDDVTVHRREEGQIAGRREQVEAVGDGGGETLLERGALAGLAAVEGHGLGVLAQAHERVAQVGLGGLLLEVERHEGPPQGERDGRSADAVDDEGREEGRVDGVEDPGEGDEVDEGGEEGEEEAQGRVGELAGVVGGVFCVFFFHFFERESFEERLCSSLSVSLPSLSPLTLRPRRSTGPGCPPCPAPRRGKRPVPPNSRP